MSSLTTVQVQSESKIKKIGQNWVYGEDLRSLTPKTKKWGNNHLSRRFGKYSFRHTHTDSKKAVILYHLAFINHKNAESENLVRQILQEVTLCK